jgi:glycosyltransferase involved in cell wall biosynthesis
VKLSFIVNTFENPLELTCCLASLRLQKGEYVDILVADNSKRLDLIASIEMICDHFKANYYKTEGECYGASEALIQYVKTEWVCFASSDGYYVPGFSSIMLNAADKFSADFVYCDCLYDPRLHGRGIYSVLCTFPELRWIDKTSFIVKTALFHGWPPHKNDWRDGAFVEECVTKGYKMVKAMGVLLVHN